MTRSKDLHLDRLYVNEYLNFHTTGRRDTVHYVSKNDTDVAHYNFEADQPILIILAEMLPVADPGGAGGGAMAPPLAAWKFFLPVY